MMEAENGFWKHWFAGFEKGLNRLDVTATEEVLGECGKACAASYTAQVFGEEWEKHRPDMKAFLSGLQERFAECEYELLDEKLVKVTYGRCFCDLVSEGYVKTPQLCRCSVQNLKENFRQALGREVSVEMVSTVLGGGEKCIFLVTV